MKAFEVTGKRKSCVVEREIPRCGDDDVLLKITAAGICGTDIHIYEGDYFGEYPIIPGHEFSGIVESVGKNIKNISIGQRVVSDPNIFCEKCYFCQQNLQNHCENFQATGVTRDGAFAEFLAVPDSTVFPVSNETILSEELAFVEPLACCVYGQKRARPDIGQNVLIFGCGPIGLLHMQLARRNGAGKIVVVDRNIERLNLAKELGADEIIIANESMDESIRRYNSRGFQMVIDATGIPAVIENEIQYIRNDGTLLLFGVCGNDQTIKISPYEIFRRDIKIVGSFALRKTFFEALTLIENGLINVKALIGEVVGMDQMPAAVEKMLNGKTSMKVILKP